jgi:hypothetical protein
MEGTQTQAVQLQRAQEESTGGPSPGCCAEWSPAVMPCETLSACAVCAITRSMVTRPHETGACSTHDQLLVHPNSTGACPMRVGLWWQDTR